jgi:hypothetical protein
VETGDSGSGQIQYPSVVATDGTYVCVADGSSDRIVKRKAAP